MSGKFGYTAEEYFGMIGDAVERLDTSSTASLRSFYASIDKVARLAVTQRVADYDIAFAAGTFAKADYLTKQLSIDRFVYRDFNEARNIIRHIDRYTDELQHLWAHDAKAVAMFVSAIYNGAEIPENLMRRFPVSPRRREQQKLLATKMRVAVVGVKDDVIVATLETTGEEVSVICSETQRYLLKLVSEGNQMNLVLPRRSRQRDDALEAEHIILHPDLLVNVTTIASCFEDYATDARIFYFNKIKPSQNTIHTLLGNFAGMMLDDTIHHIDTTYAKSILRFCRDNALAVVQCASALGTDFHTQAQKQLRHIKYVIDKVMPAEVNGFDSRQVILEPSFVCEMLGVQGRMDMLQIDFRVLVEQKAGKGVFGYGDHPGEPPRQKTKHYVQLLLYMAVLHYSYNIPQTDIFSFLLYSRYDKSLLQLGAAPALLQDAIRIRNQIAWSEYYLADGGFDIYECLSSSSIQPHATAKKFYDTYIAPALDEITDPIRKASPELKAYFKCFMTFIQKESVLSRTGTVSRDDDGSAQLWLLSAEEKAEVGNIFYKLILDAHSCETNSYGAVEYVTLRFPEDNRQDTDTSSFRNGDMVIFYPYPKKAMPDARRTMVFRANIIDISLEGIRLGLLDPQTHPDVFLNRYNSLWAVEYGAGEISSGGLYVALHSLLSTTDSRCRLLLSQRRPIIDTSVSLIGDYGDFNTLVLRAMQARDMFLVIGPPGTGKTSFAMLNILREELLYETSSVLLLSYTNRAVDEMCGKLVEQGIDFLRIGNKMACDPAYREYMIDEKVSSCSRLDDIVELVIKARVVCATVSTLNSHQELLSMRHFSLAIVDEASQILEPHIVGLLAACCTEDGEESIGRFVLIGDHKQLPAVVLQSKEETIVTNPLLTTLDIRDCRHSLFQRLLRRYVSCPDVTAMLTRQGRMHRDIAEFPSKCFYSGLLQPVPLSHQLRELPYPDEEADPWTKLLLKSRVVFVNAPLPKSSPSDKVNTVEADIIAEMTVAVYHLSPDTFSSKTTVGVIVPYRNQIATVRNAIDRHGISELHDITIDTVERYQGSQRDVIIYGFTVQHRYQLEFLTANDFVEDGVIIDPKLNVAMTRAREHLVLVGHAPLLINDEVFARLIQQL